MIWLFTEMHWHPNMAQEPEKGGACTGSVTQRDPCDTPQYWQMIRDRADRLPSISEWRMPGEPYGNKMIFS